MMILKQVTAEILVVGNELLNGTTLDTNSFWLSKRLVRSGVRVERKTTVRDELKIISHSFKDSFSRRPNWLFSIGGLGPTYDDMTIQALATAIGKILRLDKGAQIMLKESRIRREAQLYGSHIRLLKSSLKMARIPQGAVPLKNSVGSAPGVLVKFNGTTVVSFPGVPAEMKAIFAENIEPILGSSSTFFHREEWIETVGISESRLSAGLLKLTKRYKPLLYVKSHPMGFRKGNSVVHIQISLTAPRIDTKRSLNMLEVATSEMIEIARKFGANARRTKSV